MNKKTGGYINQVVNSIFSTLGLKTGLLNKMGYPGKFEDINSEVKAPDFHTSIRIDIQKMQENMLTAHIFTIEKEEAQSQFGGPPPYMFFLQTPLEKKKGQKSQMEARIMNEGELHASIVYSFSKRLTPMLMLRVSPKAITIGDCGVDYNGRHSHSQLKFQQGTIIANHLQRITSGLDVGWGVQYLYTRNMAIISRAIRYNWSTPWISEGQKEIQLKSAVSLQQQLVDSTTVQWNLGYVVNVSDSIVSSFSGLEFTKRQESDTWETRFHTGFTARFKLGQFQAYVAGDGQVGTVVQKRIGLFSVGMSTLVNFSTMDVSLGYTLGSNG